MRVMEKFPLVDAAPDLLAALEKTRQQVIDLLAAIRDMGMESRFVDDGTNMMTDGEAAIVAADSALAKAKDAPGGCGTGSRQQEAMG